MSLRTIERKTVVSQICDALVQHIVGHSLAPEDRLPSEQELAKRFGVSRATVREALKSLEILGVVTSRTGDGTYVGRFSVSSLFYQMSLFVNASSDNYDRIIEARSALEVGAIKLAASQVTGSELQELENIVESMTECLVSGDYDEVWALDTRFHETILAAAHNEILAGLIGVLRRCMQIGRQHAAKPKGALLESYMRGSITLHSGILDCLKRRNPTECAAVMETHIDSLRKPRSESGPGFSPSSV